MKEKLKLLKYPSKLLAIGAAVWLLVSSSGGCAKLGITNENVTKVMNHISSLIAVAGVISEPDKSESVLQKLLSDKGKEKNKEDTEKQSDEKKSE